MDTEEAQALLHYQVYTFDDYLKEMGERLGRKKALARLLGPGIRFYFSMRSPYFRSPWRRVLGLAPRSNR